MKEIKNKQTNKPSAWVVNPTDRGRFSVKSGKVFLPNKFSFEIELFNPLKECVLADIKLNKQSISKTGLVLKPGQRFYLDCFIDDKKKFIFNTYEIENSEESLEASQNNGLLEVFFYKESVITIDNWRDRFDRVIIDHYHHYYPYYPYYPYKPWNPWNIYYSNGTTLTTGITYNGSSGSVNSGIVGTTTGPANFSSYDGSSANYTCSVNNIETGRVEKGSSSSQKFGEIDMDFDSYYIASTVIQILPESRKPVETKEILNKKIELKDILKRESSDVIELIKKLGELHTAGILTDKEFNDKKSELLSKI